MVPYTNTVATLTLRGGALLEALENGLSRLPEQAGRFPQVAGMRLVLDPAAPPGRRVRGPAAAAARWTRTAPTAW